MRATGSWTIARAKCLRNLEQIVLCVRTCTHDAMYFDDRSWTEWEFGGKSSISVNENILCK